MRKIRDVLRLHAEGMSKRKIAASLSIGATAAGDTVRRARRAGLRWPLPAELGDGVLERLLYPAPQVRRRIGDRSQIGRQFIASFAVPAWRFSCCGRNIAAHIPMDTVTALRDLLQKFDRDKRTALQPSFPRSRDRGVPGSNALCAA
jgi:hypothetical protein